MTRGTVLRDLILVIGAGVTIGFLLWVGHVLMATVGDAIS